MDAEKTLKFLDDLCAQALTEARQGNAVLANRLGANPALAHYFNNVATVRAVPREAWGAYYPQYLQEADHVRQQVEQAEAATQQGDRITALEAKIQELTEAVSALVEREAPAKPRRKAKAKAEQPLTEDAAETTDEADEAAQDAEPPADAEAEAEPETEGETPAAPTGEGADDEAG